MDSDGYFDFFISNVEKEGQFLKIWGQRDRTGAITVERSIIQLLPDFERGIGVVDPKLLHADLLCCAQYQDGSYYRAKIMNVDWANGCVNCIFIDFGNRDRVSFADVRILPPTHELWRIPGQAGSFLLSGVVGVWDASVLQQVMSKIAYEEVKGFVVKSIGPGPQVSLIKVYQNGVDIVELVRSQGWGTVVPQDNFEVLVWNMLGLPAAMHMPARAVMTAPNYSQLQNPMMNVMWPMIQQMPGPNLMHPMACAPTAMPVIAPMELPAHSHVPAKIASIPPAAVDLRKSPEKAVTNFSTITLENNTEHKVYISHCEKGSLSFCVQLSEFNEDLEKLSSLLNNPAVIANFTPLKQPYIPGTICLSRFQEDDNIYRAVITAVETDKCCVYFVDFGNSDFVKCKDMFEIPAEYTHFKVMALQFSLAGLNNVSCTDDMLSIFYDLALEKEAVLKVVPPKCQELVAKQLGHLFIDDTNVVELINAEILKKQPKIPMFRNVYLPASGSKVKVVVAYVKSLENFYVQLSAQQNELESMMSIVSQYCNGPAKKMRQSDVEPGASCCALFPADGQWYRAFIVNAEMDNLRVMYVDYGNEETVSLDDLRVATDNVVAPLRAQAIPCRLAGFESKATDESLVARFEELCLDNTFNMNVVELIESIPCVVVKLFDENGTDVNNLLTAHPVPSVNENAQSVARSNVKSEFDSRSKILKESSNTNDWNPPVSKPARSVGVPADSVPDSRDRNKRDQDRPNAQCQRSDSTAWGIGDRKGKSDIGHCDRVSNYDQPPKDSYSSSKRIYEEKQSLSNRNKQSSYNNTKVPEETWNDSPVPQTSSIGNLTIDIGCKKPVDIVYSINPNDFYLQERPVDPCFPKLMDQIAEHYNSGGELLPSSLRTVGTVCIAKYSEDETYYRGIIKEVGSGKALISFVDYGNKEMVDFNDLKKIGAEFLGIKAQAIHCQLKGVPSNGWSDDGLAEFISLSDCEDLEAEFVEVQDPATYSIILRDTSKQSVLNETFGATQSSMLSPTSIVSSVAHQLLADGSEHDVTVSWFETPGRFYVQLKSTQDDFKKLMYNLQKDYATKVPLAETSIGQVVVAKYQDGALYRALVKVQKGDKYGVQYLDYGNKSLVTTNNIFGLENRYSSLPAQAIPCSLQGVIPIGAQWTKNPQIEKYFTGGFKATFMASGNLEVPYTVSLSSIGDPMKNIADVLISNQLGNAEQVEDECKEAPVQDPKAKCSVYHEPIDPDLLVGQTLAALCVHVDEAILFVSFEADSLAHIRQEVAACNPDELVHLPPQSATSGKVCLVMEQQLRRAVILDNKATGGIAVQFMDFGFVEEVSSFTLYEMPERFARVGSLVFECTTNVEPSKLKDLPQQNVVLVIESFSDRRFCGHFVSEPQLLQSPILRRKIEVTVMHASGSHVWLQKATDVDRVASLLDDLFDTYENSGEPLSSGQPSMLCAAKSVEDENWYRAEVKGEDSSDMVLVHYIDYGNDALVPVNNLKKLTENFLKIPLLSVKASLPVVAEEDLGETILNMANDKTFTAVFSKNNQQWLVELLDGKMEFSLQLIQTGKAMSMENSPFPSLLSEPSDRINLSVGSIFLATVSFMESTSDFYVHHDQEVESLEKLQSDLQTLSHCLKPFNGVPEIGSKCMALYTEDDTWYRGIVRPDKKIYFMDYGNEDSVCEGNMKILPPAMEKVKGYGIKCTLDLPMKKQWAPEATDRFQQLFESAGTLTVVSVRGDTLVVTVNVAGKDISNILAEEGFLQDKSGEETQCVSVISAKSPSDFWVNFVDSDQNSMHCTMYLPSDISEWSEAAVSKFKEYVSTSSVFEMVTLLPGDPAMVSLMVNGNKIEQELVDMCQKLTERMEATVAFFNSPTDFYIHLIRDADALEEIANSLILADKFDSLEDPTIGKRCAALFSEDDLWYRARIIGGSSPDFEVSFIDYGNEAVTKSIKSLPLNLLSMPPFAIHCSVPHPDGSPVWSDVALKKLDELVESDTKFEIEFLSSEEPFLINLTTGGLNINCELAKLSGIDISVMDELIASLRSSFRETNGNAVIETTGDSNKLINSQVTVPDEANKFPNVTPVSSTTEEFPIQCDDAECKITLGSDNVSESHIDVSNSSMEDCLIKEKISEEICLVPITAEDVSTKEEVDCAAELDDSVVLLLDTQISPSEDSFLEIVESKQEILVITIDDSIDAPGDIENQCSPCDESVSTNVTQTTYQDCLEITEDATEKNEELNNPDSSAQSLATSQECSKTEENISETDDALTEAGETIQECFPSSDTYFKESVDSSDLIEPQTTHADCLKTVENATEKDEEPDKPDSSVELLETYQLCSRTEENVSEAEEILTNDGETGSEIVLPQTKYPGCLATLENAIEKKEELDKPDSSVQSLATTQKCSKIEENISETDEALTEAGETIQECFQSSDADFKELVDSSDIVEPQSTHPDCLKTVKNATENDEEPDKPDSSVESLGTHQECSEKEGNIIEKDDTLTEADETIQEVQSFGPDFKELVDGSEIVEPQSTHPDCLKTVENVIETFEKLADAVQSLQLDLVTSEVDLTEADETIQEVQSFGPDFKELVDGSEIVEPQSTHPDCLKTVENVTETFEKLADAVQSLQLDLVTSEVDLTEADETIQEVQSFGTDFKELVDGSEIVEPQSTHPDCLKTVENVTETFEKLADAEKDVQSLQLDLVTSEVDLKEVVGCSEVVVSLKTYPDWKSCESDTNDIDLGQCVASAFDFSIDRRYPGVKLYTFEDCENHNFSIDVVSSVND